MLYHIHVVQIQCQFTVNATSNYRIGPINISSMSHPVSSTYALFSTSPWLPTSWHLHSTLLQLDILQMTSVTFILVTCNNNYILCFLCESFTFYHSACLYILEDSVYFPAVLTNQAEIGTLLARKQCETGLCI